MRNRRAVAAVVLGVAATGAVLAGTGTASAFAYRPGPDRTAIDFNSGEAAVISQLNLGPAMGQLIPGWSPTGKNVVGQEIGYYSGLVASNPGTTLGIDVYGPITGPSKIGVGIYR